MLLSLAQESNIDSKLNIYKFTVMTSPCELQIYCDDVNKAKKTAQQILNTTKALEIKYNFYNQDSYLSLLNRRETNILDMQTKDILNRAKLFYTHTNQIFDITMGTLAVTRKENSIEKVEEATHRLMPFIGFEHLKIKKDKLYFDNPHTQIDLGGFIKEFAVDQAVKILKKNKIKSALVNFGGDIYALGTKPKDKAFVIGIKNPLSPDKYITQASITNLALTTSASYERSTNIENKSYSHIITTKALQEQILSTTVIAPTALEAGVFSTSLMIDPTLKTKHQTILISDTLEINS